MIGTPQEELSITFRQAMDNTLTSAESLALSDYPVLTVIAVLWGDEDAFGHVNNVAYLRWCESARVDYCVVFTCYRTCPARYLTDRRISDLPLSAPINLSGYGGCWNPRFHDREFQLQNGAPGVQPRDRTSSG